MRGRSASADELKGEIPVGFVVLKAGVTRECTTTIAGELVDACRANDRRRSRASRRRSS